jgi:hypothetical protein
VTRIALVCAAAVMSLACGKDTSGPTCHLVPGDLVISEIMANPSGDDTGHEWFEVYNPGSKTVDLAGVTLLTARSDGSSPKAVTLPGPLDVRAGEYLVFGGVAPDLKPAYVTYGYGPALGGLLNANGLLAVQCGSVVIDQATYMTAPDGASLELSGVMAPDALANDNAANWCAAKTEFEPGNKGTPGAANESCSGTGPQGMCQDGGVMRATRQPAVGDLVVSEVMADPAGTDTDEEWLELYVAHDVDLNGVQLGTAVGTVKDTLTDTACIKATAGSYLVFARSTDSMKNGGLPAVFHTESLTLANAGGMVVVSVGGSVVDQATYPAAKSGVSSSLDPAALSATGNDDPAAFCGGVASYGAGGKGTPGAANPACPK